MYEFPTGQNRLRTFTLKTHADFFLNCTLKFPDLMKKIVGIVALLSLFHAASFAGPGPEKTISIRPVFKLSGMPTEIPENAPGMRKTKIGRGMTIGGGVLLVTGLALASTADSYSYSYTTSSNGTTTESGDIKGAIGVLFIAGGVGLTIPGIIIWSKGAKRLKEYKETNNLTFDLRGTSGVLTYHF
jgi:hypothetical protein